MTFLTRLLGLAGVACVAVLMTFWFRMVVSPAPQEMREGALVLSTMALLEGRNPYALDTLPFTANLYGPLYPLVTVPFAAVAGPSLLVHRLVDGAGILMACAILFRVLRRHGVGRIAALAGAGLNLAGLLYWVGPASRPDGVGMALMMGAYAVMAPDPASGRRFTMGLALSMLGFATKIYYVLPVFAAALWVTVFVSAARGAVQTVVALASLVATTVGLAWVFPAWAPVVLGANLGAAHYSLAHLVRQTGDWAIFSLPLLAALAFGAHRGRGAADLWSVALGCGVAAVGFALGGHSGAHMTYLFHLISPPLTVVALRAAERRPLARLAFAAMLPVAAVLNAHWFPFDLERLRRAEAAFGRAATTIAAATTATATTEFAPLLAAAGHEPLETGHSEYFRATDPPWLLAWLWSPRAALDAAERRTTTDLRRDLDARRFDVILANRRDTGLFRQSDLLASGYRQVDRFDVDLWWAQQSWPVDVWRR